MVKLISEIAFKTNLLAFNATIEGAHAAATPVFVCRCGLKSPVTSKSRQTAEETAKAILTIRRLPPRSMSTIPWGRKYHSLNSSSTTNFLTPSLGFSAQKPLVDPPKLRYRKL